MTGLGVAERLGRAHLRKPLQPNDWRCECSPVAQRLNDSFHRLLIALRLLAFNGFWSNCVWANGRIYGKDEVTLFYAATQAGQHAYPSQETWERSS